MDTKHIHCMLEGLAEYGKCMIEAGVGSGNVNLCDAGQIVDMVKDLACAEKDALIAKEMRKAHEDDEAEEKYIRKMLKEENKDEFKRYMEEYGDDGERRFYDDWRYASGRFAPKGRGSYEPRRSGRRRGYEEPPYWHMMPYDYMDGYDYDDAERMRDLDRKGMNRMYFSEPMRSRDMGNNYSGRMGGDMGGNSRMHDSKEGRSWNSRRTYMEAKETNKGNTPEEKRQKMTELERYMGELGTDISEMIMDASPEEKNLLKQKLQVLTQKIN